jgi:hypothetical protein
MQTGQLLAAVFSVLDAVNAACFDFTVISMEKLS